MNLKKISLALAASALFFTACSDSSSSSAPEEDSSSSAADISSSSQKAEDADAIQKIMSEMPNMDLGERFGGKLWLTAGANGLYSLWVIDSSNPETSYGTVAKTADISSGKLTFTKDDGVVYAAGEAQGDEFLAELEKGISLEFAVKDSSLTVSINGKEAKEVGKATRKVTKDYLSRSDSLVGKKAEWSTGDASSIYRFFKNGEYVRISVAENGDNKEDLFEAGYYDVHRQHLLLLPAYHVGKVTSLGNYTVKVDDDDLIFEGATDKKTYHTTAMKVEYPKVSDLTDHGWESESNDTLKWTLDFKYDEYRVVGKTGLSDNTMKVRRLGKWAVFGDYLVLTVDTCQAAKSIECKTERGAIQNLTADSFKFDNFDSKSEYATPKKWSVVKME